MLKDVSFKKIGAIAILGTMLTGIMTIVEPVVKFSTAIFAVSAKYQQVNAAIVKHDTVLSEHKVRLDTSDSSIREFRSVWCIDRLTSSKKVNPYVLETCGRWIKKP